MQLPCLITSDPHLTASPRDEYRWSLFDQLAEESKYEQAKSIVIAGDLTDAKDYHSAKLVNRVVAGICKLREHVDNVYILMGNHDFLLGGHAYFEFLNRLPGVRYITKPSECGDFVGPLTYFLPYTKTPSTDWAAMDFSHYEFLFMHQTVSGSIASNGMKMEGEPLPSLKGPKVYSGDIHVPQVIGDVEYIGSPYHVHFGDKYKPRCLLLDRRGRAEDIQLEFISRMTITVSSLRELKREKIKAGDQVKLRMSLEEGEKHDWHRVRREAALWLKDQGAEVCDVELLIEKRTRRKLASPSLLPSRTSETPSDTVLGYVMREGLGADALDTGLEIVK